MPEQDLSSDFFAAQDDDDGTNSSSLKVWNNVPDNTTLELRLEPEGGAFVGHAVLAIQGVEVEEWSDEEIHPGPKTRNLATDDGRYSVNVFVGFPAGQETAILTAVLLDESGDPIREPYVHAITTQDTQAAILINMA